MVFLLPQTLVETLAKNLVKDLVKKCLETHLTLVFCDLSSNIRPEIDHKLPEIHLTNLKKTLPEAHPEKTEIVNKHSCEFPHNITN